MIIEFIEGVTLSAFLEDDMRQAAVCMHLINIGEEVNNLEDGIKELMNINWHAIRGFRNRLAYDYDDTNFEKVLFGN